MRFDQNPFTCQCKKRKQKSLRVQISHFQSSFLSDIMAVKRLTSTETIRLLGGGGGGGGRRLYTYYYTVNTRMTPELRWAAMRAILMFH